VWDERIVPLFLKYALTRRLAHFGIRTSLQA
jgi:hypothetical protein